MAGSENGNRNEPTLHQGKRQNLKNGHVTITTPIYGVICHPFGNTWYCLYSCV